MRRAVKTTRPLAILLAAAGLAVAATTAQAPTPAQAGPRALLGLMDDGLFTGQPDVAFQAVDQLHPQIIRYDADWAVVAVRKPKNAANPNDPAYHWAGVDTLVTRAHQAGIAVVLTIAHTPTWAGGTAKHNHAPRKGSDLQNFAYAAATRYSGHFKGPDGTVLPQVTRWEAWNEPNTNTHLSPQYVCVKGKGFWCRGGHFNLVSPTTYAGILNAIYTGVHKAGTKYHVNEQVAGGATKPGGDGPTAAEPSVNPTTFVTALAKRHPKLDAYAHHPYRVPGAKCQTCGGLVTIDNLSKLLKAVDKGWPGRRLHLWLTEYGAQTKPPDPLGVTLAQQSTMLRHAVQVMRKNPRIDMLIWFLIRDQKSTGSLASGWQSGLAYVNGNKKPIWNVFSSLAESQ
jgi:hypothetical protein